MIVRELITKLGFNTDENAAKKYEARIRSIKIGAAAVVAAVAAAGAGLFSIVKSAADFGDSVYKTSQRVGVGVEALQRLQYAAGLADLENSEFSQGLVFLSKNLVAAAGGSKETAKAFAGIKLKGANGQLRATDDVLLDLSDKFKNMQDGPKKTALAVQIFGRAGSRMIPFLNAGAAGIRDMGKELDDLGLVMGVDAAKAGEQFNDNLRRMHVIFSGIKNIIGAKLLPVFLKLTERFLDFIKSNRDAIKNGATKFFSFLADVLARVWRIGTAAVRMVENLIDAMGGFQKAMKVLIPAGIGFGIILGAINPITIAVVALSTAIGLLADDFLSFKDGQASLLPWEDILKKIEESIAKIRVFVQDLKDEWRGLNIEIQNTVNFLQGLKEKFFKSVLGERIGQFIIDKSKTPEGQAAGKQFIDSPLFNINDTLLAPFKYMIDDFKSVGRAAVSAQASPALASGPPQPGTVSSNKTETNKFDIKQNINVTVDGGGDPEQIAAFVKKHVKDENDSMWRNVQRNLQPGTSN